MLRQRPGSSARVRLSKVRRSGYFPKTFLKVAFPASVTCRRPVRRCAASAIPRAASIKAMPQQLKQRNDAQERKRAAVGHVPDFKIDVENKQRRAAPLQD